jgi:ATP-dependent RNA helicase SUPV3L1/SUV3
VRFGEFSLFIPSMLKPSPAELLAILWGVHNERFPTDPHPETPAPSLPAPGLTSVPRDKDLPAEFYSAAGFRVCGARAVRIDMLERLGQMIREARTPEKAKPKQEQQDAAPKVQVEVKKKQSKLAEQKTEEVPAETSEAAPADSTAPEPVDSAPAPAAEETTGEKKPVIPASMFEASVDMMSIVGCSGDEFDGILRALGFKTHTIRVEGGDDLTVWRSAPRGARNPNAKGRGRPQNARGGDGKAQGRGPRHGKGKGKGGPKGGPGGGKGGKGNYQSRPPRREKKADPDSPFAVLAALKDDLKS